MCKYIHTVRTYECTDYTYSIYICKYIRTLHIYIYVHQIVFMKALHNYICTYIRISFKSKMKSIVNDSKVQEEIQIEVHICTIQYIRTYVCTVLYICNIVYC